MAGQNEKLLAENERLRKMVADLGDQLRLKQLELDAAVARTRPPASGGVSKTRRFDANGLRLAEFQAKLFERSVERFDCSSKIFLRRFLHSKVAALLDENDFSRIPLTVNEALDGIEEQFGVSDYGSVKYPAESMFWIGYLHRYISYTRGVGTPLLFSLFRPEQLNSLYYVYHTQDLDWCVGNLLSLNGLTEDVFDCNWRLRQVMKAAMAPKP